MSQSEPANRCSEIRMKKLLPLKLREKLYRTLILLLHILIIGQSLGISAVIAKQEN